MLRNSSKKKGVGIFGAIVQKKYGKKELFIDSELKQYGEEDELDLFLSN